ncbi:MAG TPA: YihY/virulence factor BrkB family protein [Steroidobacteraceae bacterium]|jgi:membrane protein|nr:YihY/virulence factor BrkB family protein [Steroidobacteraceae bacterium]
MATTLDRLQERLFHGSRSMAPPWGPLLRVLRYPAAIGRDWLAGEISGQAMSLAYTTLLSLVPLLVFSFAILKGLGARTDLYFLLHEFFRPLGGAANQLAESVTRSVSNMRGDVVGSIGLIFLLYSVISTIQKIEASFNFVWRLDRPRSLVRRLTEYLSIMIIGPILLAVALGLLGSALHSSAAQWLGSSAHLGWLVQGLAWVLPYAIVTAVFTFMYDYIPNTHVEFRAALIGGVTGGIIWGLVGQVFTALILYSSRMMVVYSGFAIVLTTLIWIYLSWLILLVGAELAFYVQFPQYLPHGRESIVLTGSMREQIALAVMYLLARDYRDGFTHWNGVRLAAELDLPATSLASVLASLEKAALIVRTEHEHFLPGRDPARIPISSVIEAVRAPQSGVAPAGQAAAPAARVLEEVDAALRESLGGRSVRDLLGPE